MRYTAAYLLAILGGNPSPDVAAIAKILGSVGIECDEKRAQQVVDACHGKNVDDIIAKGMEKIENLTLANTSEVTNIVDPPKKEPEVPGQTPANDSPPGSPSGEGMVSHYFNFHSYIMLYFNSSTCSDNEKISTLGKSRSKQEFYVTMLLLLFFVLFNENNKICTNFFKYEILNYR